MPPMSVLHNFKINMQEYELSHLKKKNLNYIEDWGPACQPCLPREILGIQKEVVYYFIDVTLSCTISLSKL